MNRDVTQRLLKDSIICLCRSHIFTAGLDGINFEIDGLICISQGDGSDTDQQMVFKIHELVQADGDAKKDTYVSPSFGGSQVRAYSNNHGAPKGSRPRSHNAQLVSNGALNFQTRAAVQLVSEYSNCQNNEIVTTPVTMTTSGRKRKTTSPRHCPQLTKYSHARIESVPSTNIPDASASNANSEIIPTVIKEEPEWLGDDGGETIQNYFNNKDDNVQTTNGSASGGDNERAFSCARCNFKCEIEGDVEEHMKLKHGSCEVHVCPGCGVAYESETLFSNHCVSSNCSTAQFHDAGVSSSDRTARASTSVEKSARNNLANSSTQNRDESFTVLREKTEDPSLAPPNRSVALTSCGGGGETGSTAPTSNDRKEFQTVDDNDVVDEEESLDQSKPRKCAECRVEFADFPSLNVHSSDAHGIFPCPYCARTFAQESQRETHLFEHTGESSPMECERCNLSFSRADSLTRHLAKAHGVVVYESKREIMPDVASRDETITKNWDQIRCSLPLSQSESNATANNYNMLTASEFLERITNNYGCVDPAIEISDEDDETNASFVIGSRVMALDPWRTFRCEICPEHFPGVASYTDHCALVHRRIPCPYCGATFTQKASMERHQRQHTGVKPFRCTICANSFTRKETLHTHMSRMHPVLDYGLY